MPKHLDYKELITKPFTIVWRHRWLWLFGFFAGSGGGGFNFNFGGGSSWRRDVNPRADLVLARLQTWVAQNLALIIVVAAILLFLFIIFLVASFVARGALVGGVHRIDRDEETSIGDAFRTGLRHFWPVLLLSALLALIVLGPLLAVGLVVALFAVLLGVAGAIAAGILLGVPFLIVLIPLVIVLGILGNYGLRFIVIEDRAPVPALKEAWRLFREQLGVSLLIWLIALGLAIGAGIALVIGLIILAIPAVVLGIITFVGTFKPAIFAVFLVLALAVLVILFVAAAAVNSYFSAYWTIAWLRLTKIAAEE